MNKKKQAKKEAQALPPLSLVFSSSSFLIVFFPRLLKAYTNPTVEERRRFCLRFILLVLVLFPRLLKAYTIATARKEDEAFVWCLLLHELIRIS